MTETRLDSWKEIAAYLHRDVSTVRRWEKREGLPVHRHVHDKLGSVYAFSSEIDEWLRRRRSDEPQAPDPLPLSPPARHPLVMWVAAVVLAGLTSLSIVGGLRRPIAIDESREDALRHTRYASNVEVYELYLRGRYHWKKRSPDGYQRAIDAFSRVIARDPAFAPAYAGLADTYLLMGYYAHLMPFDESRSKAKAAAVTAISLDDSLAEAHTSMGGVLEREWDWSGSEREYKRAIELAPNYASAHHWYANNLALQGRHDEAIAAARRAVAIEPLSPILHVALGHAYLVAGQYDEAIGQLQKALEIEPALPNAHQFLGLAFQRKGMYDKALAEMHTANATYDSWLWKAYLAHLYMTMNRREEAMQLVSEFNTSRPRVSLVTSAALYAAVGERDRALALLEQACNERDPDAAGIIEVPVFESLHRDPVFQSLLRRIGLS
jgi:tetratricopeptide (TPR) repeat protein